MNKFVSQKHLWVTFALCAATVTQGLAQVQFATLANFDLSNGASVNGSLVQGLDGNFYGTSLGGGANDLGTVFKVTPTGTLTTLYSFCSESNCADGEYPWAALVLGTDGNLYGTTELGGAYLNGTVFKITPLGALTTLYSFCSPTNCTDGRDPLAPLLIGADGNFYGTTAVGGVFNYGTIFKITPRGALTTLYTFTAGTDGADPDAGLIQATDGNFYGTAAGAGQNGGGTIFSISPAGSFAVLYSFAGFGTPSGTTPVAGLVQSSNGSLYGTTVQGGDYGFGTVFRITTSGTLAALHAFTGMSDGANPSSQLVQGTDGNLYGTTGTGGLFSDQCPSADGCGTVFQMTPRGRLTTLHRFCAQAGCPDGDNLPAGLLQATDGKFYGTTANGGSSTACSYGCGTVFSLSVGLGPFVETLPASGSAGRTVRILGTNLTGATSVTFNGTPATFTVEAPSVIKTTVPTGATTGTVQVVTPGGTLSSNVPFRVAP